MTLLGWRFPSDEWRIAAYLLRGMAAIALPFLILDRVAEKNRLQYKRGNQDDKIYNLKIRHDLTSFAFVMH